MSHPLLLRMREAGMLKEDGGGTDGIKSHDSEGRSIGPTITTSIDLQLPVVSLAAEDSISLVGSASSRSPALKNVKTGGPQKTSSGSRASPTYGRKKITRITTSDKPKKTSVDRLASAGSTFSATQRNVQRLKSVDEESVGSVGWGKLRKAVKSKKKKVPIKTPLDKGGNTTTPRYRMGERDQVIMAKDEIKILKKEKNRLRDEVRALVQVVSQAIW